MTMEAVLKFPSGSTNTKARTVMATDIRLIRTTRTTTITAPAQMSTPTPIQTPTLTGTRTITTTTTTMTSPTPQTLIQATLSHRAAASLATAPLATAPLASLRMLASGLISTLASAALAVGTGLRATVTTAADLEISSACRLKRLPT